MPLKQAMIAPMLVAPVAACTKWVPDSSMIAALVRVQVPRRLVRQDQLG